MAALKLVDAPRCPYCARVRIALAEKGIAHEAVVIDLEDRPAWLYELNPVGRVPVLESDGWALPESVVINEFLEERYPEPSAASRRSRRARAAARLQVFRDDDLTKPYYALRRQQDGAEEAFAAALADLDATLADAPFLTGAAFGLADIALVPWVIRARDMLGVSLEPYPHVDGWLARLAERRRSPQRSRSSPACERRPARRARTAARRGRARSSSTCARPASSPVRIRIPLRCAPGPPAGRPQRRPPAPAGCSRRGGDQGSRRRPRGLRGDRVLPLRRPVGDGRTRSQARPATTRGTTWARGTSGRRALTCRSSKQACLRYTRGVEERVAEPPAAVVPRPEMELGVPSHDGRVR